VRTAVGFDQKRGDQIEVVNLRFAEAPAAPIQEPSGVLSFLQMTKDDIMRAIELAVMGLLGLVVVLFVVRPLVRRILTPEGPQAAAVAALAGVGAIAGGAPALPDTPIPIPPSQTAKMIDMAQVQGQVHAQSMLKVGELAERNPHETVAIVRQWLQDTPL
jgi:flagellar M-ring protein FliF